MRKNSDENPGCDEIIVILTNLTGEEGDYINELYGRTKYKLRIESNYY